MRRLLLGIILLTACTATDSATSTISVVPPSTPATTSVPTASTTIPPPSDPESPLSLIEDPITMSADQIREAGALRDGRGPGGDFAIIFSNGDEEQQQAVLDVLSAPTAWNVQMLTGMALGRPTASSFPGAEWPSDLRAMIESTRNKVAAEVFGDRAPLAVNLMQTMMYWWSDDGQAASAVWYDLPEVLGDLDGELIGSAFQGEAIIGSDTGEAHTLTVRAQCSWWNDECHWGVLDGQWLQSYGGHPEYRQINRGDKLDPTALPALLDGTIAVSVAGDLVLLEPDGGLMGHLPFHQAGYSQRWTGSPRVIGPNGGFYRLTTDGLTPTQDNPEQIELRDGSVLAWDGEGWRISDQSGDLVFGPAWGDTWTDSTGRVISVAGESQTVTFDTETGAVEYLPKECVVLHAGESILSCRRQNPETSTLESTNGTVLVGVEHWGPLYEAAGWPSPNLEPAFIAGHWRGVAPGPNDDTYLLRWSGECESTDTFLLSDGELRHITGLDLESAPAAYPGGWLPDGRAVFALAGYNVGCGRQAEVPGVYAISLDGELELLWDSGGRDLNVAVLSR